MPQNVTNHPLKKENRSKPFLFFYLTTRKVLMGKLKLISYK